MISITILTRNSARHLPKVLDSVRSFDEVVVLDSGSSDGTLAMARQFPNVKVYATQFKGFGPLHNEAAAMARNDWIFSVDSDEVVTPELAQEIATLLLDEDSVYSVSMRNYFNGRWIRHGGWHPDRHVRLFNRKKTRFTNAEVHEGVITDGLREVALAGPVLHFPYDSVADFLTKTQSYTDLYARQNRGIKSSSLTKAITRATAAFLKSYLLQRGFLEGREGFIIASSHAHATFYKYLKLLEANQKPVPAERPAFTAPRLRTETSGPGPGPAPLACVALPEPPKIHSHAVNFDVSPGR